MKDGTAWRLDLPFHCHSLHRGAEGKAAGQKQTRMFLMHFLMRKEKCLSLVVPYLQGCLPAAVEAAHQCPWLDLLSAHSSVS